MHFYLILGAGINYAWLAYPYFYIYIHIYLIFPVRSADKFSVDRLHVSSHLPLHDKIKFYKKHVFIGAIFLTETLTQVLMELFQNQAQAWLNIYLGEMLFCCMCQVIQLTCICVDNSNNFKKTKHLLFFNKNTVLGLKNI